MNLLEEKLEKAVTLKNILFATDFSQASDTALPYVAALSLRYGSMVHVAHVLPGSNLVRPSPIDPALFGTIYEQAHSNAQEQIQRVSDQLRGFPHQRYIRHGKVCDVLAEIVREQNIDLLVAGTHGRSGLGKLVMGSVAEEVFRQAPCPVLTVGPNVETLGSVKEGQDHALPPIQIRFRHVLYASDFGPNSAKTVFYAASLAREFQARLTLLHVIEDYGDRLHERPGPIEETLRKLEGLVPHVDAFRYRPDFVAEYGDPAELILRSAVDRNVDLVVLSARPAVGRIVAATRFGGSTAHKVVVAANCPVLTVRN